MIITCPSCSKRYAIPDHLFGEKGRELRCDACEHQWFHSIEAKTAPAPEKTKSSVTKDQNASSHKMGWVLLLISISALLGTLYVTRTQLTERFPQLAGVYNALGAHQTQATMNKLTLSQLNPVLSENEQGNSLISVSGLIHNQSQETLVFKGVSLKAIGRCEKAPMTGRLRHFLSRSQDKNGCVLYSWEFEPSDTKLFPGESVSFETKPPQDILGAEKISVSLF